MKLLTICFLLGLLPVAVLKADVVAPAAEAQAVPSVPADAEKVSELIFPERVTVTDLTAAARYAGKRRKWTQVQASGGLVELRIVRSDYETSLWFKCEKGSMQIFAKSVYKGSSSKPEKRHPYNWIKFLERDINQFLR